MFRIFLVNTMAMKYTLIPLLFLVNMACASCSPDVFFNSEKDIYGSQISEKKPLGLFAIYYENPEKISKNESIFCVFQYRVNYSGYGESIIEAQVTCNFTEVTPAFIVRKVFPAWVKCEDPLLRVEFTEKPLDTQTLSKARVANNTVKYSLPFVEGKASHLAIFCESHKARIVFDLGLGNKQSTTINFLEMARSSRPPKESQAFSQLLFAQMLEEQREKPLESTSV